MGVWEWCADWRDGNYYSVSPAKNPLGPDTGNERVMRGGDWWDHTRDLRVAVRAWSQPEILSYRYGFRCVSGSDFTSGASAGGDFTSDEGAPLLLADRKVLDLVDISVTTVRVSVNTNKVLAGVK